MLSYFVVPAEMCSSEPLLETPVSRKEKHQQLLSKTHWLKATYVASVGYTSGLLAVSFADMRIWVNSVFHF